ncbi:MAG: metallophosphoesterase [Caldilineaceae bacterium]
MLALLALLSLLIVAFVAPVGKAPTTPLAAVHFAIVGDFGVDTTAEADVATLIRGWNPDFVVTVGDNNYPDGKASTIDKNIGKYYQEFIAPYHGDYGPGAATNRFFPVLGNHDWHSIKCSGQDCTGAYFDYFELPNNERYYDFVQGPVHFFMLDSDSGEPDGIKATSVQAAWLQAALAASTARWKVVLLHHPPYSSGTHGSTSTMQWPYAAWGADAVFAGHDHIYERLLVDGFPYFVNGAGGRNLYSCGSVIPASVICYDSDYGAMLVDADDTTMTLQFINRAGEVIDSSTLRQADAPTPSMTMTAFTPTPTATPTVTPTPSTRVTAVPFDYQIHLPLVQDP